MTVHTFPVGNAADYKEEIISKLGGEQCVASIDDGLDLLLNPKRIIADLRG